MAGLPAFSKIEFGFSDAETESEESPHLLTEGWFDGLKITESIVDGRACLVLGNKGCGKSSVGQHFELKYQTDHSVFVTNVFLRDFPFKSFGKIFSGDLEAQAKYPTTWAWLLLLRVIDSIRRDEGSRTNLDPDFLDAIRKLELAGVLPAQDLKQIVISSSKTKFKASIAKAFDFAWEQDGAPTSSDLQFLTLVDKLKAIVSRFRGPNIHLFFIDGLDDILTSREQQFESLAALVNEVASLNVFFKKNSVPAKIVLCCRTELYERLPGPNKNKLRQDKCVELDWYGSPLRREHSLLAQLAAKRAALKGAIADSFWKDYFPEEINGTATLQYLLDHTRHTPRDFLQLLVQIQKSTVTHAPTTDSVIAGLREYSLKYFLPEIYDELSGYVSVADKDEFFKLLAVVKDREFMVSALIAEAEKGNWQLDSTKIKNILSAMFDCSAVGNHLSIAGGSRDQYVFKHRNRASLLDFTKPIQLHRGLWKALGMA
jgi:hypothetical protein